ncbi:MAG TPA: hypothetical protein DEO84_00815, partial [candidate division Zixibacteria bacterium]|nr:hypothetical protein [candidate division Zixibacteria bacterium]
SFETRWRKELLSDPDRKERLRVRARDLLERFLLLQSERTAVPFETEKKFRFSLSSEPGNQPPRLVGRIDRIDKNESGLEIVDYKTGKKMKESDLKSDLQLPIYALACLDRFSEIPGRLTYMFLGDGTTHDATYDRQSLDKIKDEILVTIDEINSTDFLATPGYICGTCDYNKICPARGE